MTKAKRYDTVVLLGTINGFQKGEKGAVVEVYTTPYEAYDIEIVTDEGTTKGLVEAIRPEQIEVVPAIQDAGSNLQFQESRLRSQVVEIRQEEASGEAEGVMKEITMDLFGLQKDFVKTLIRDTIETYSGQWRLVHEAIQNAHDSIQLNEKIGRGKVEVHLHVASNIVSVKDNGTGISIDNFPKVFLIGGSDKTDEHLRKILKGSQGVGIKSTLFTSEMFKVESVYEGHAWDYKVTDCYKFDEPNFNVEIKPPNPKPSRLSSGSIFTYSLPKYTVQDFLNEIVNEYCDETSHEELQNVEELKTVIEIYFRTKTYLGCVQSMLDINPDLKPIDVEVKLCFDSPSLEDHKSIDIDRCSFISDEDYYRKEISHTFLGKHIDVLEMHNNLSPRNRVDQTYRDFEEILSKRPDQTLKKILVQKLDKSGVKRLLDKPTRDRQTGDLSFEPNPVLLHKHRTVLERINGMYLVIGQRTYLSNYFHIEPKQNISINGLPTNISLNLPHGALSYLNNVYIVLDADYPLGYGKRNLPSRSKGIIDAFFLDAWNILRRVAPLLVGQKEGTDPSQFAVWDKEEELDNYEDGDNLLGPLPLFFKTTPQEEQEVVSLFFELIGGRLLRGYFPFRVGGNRTTYDALFFIDQNEGEKLPRKIRPRELKTVEFKFQLSGLIQDFMEEVKFLDDIDLVVCWENDCNDDLEYNISSLERDGIAPFPGAQLRMHKGTRMCQVLVLKEFIESLKFGPP